MKDMRAEKIEALETLAEFNERLLKNLPILAKELSGERLEDTDKFLNDVIKAINWEIEVVNLTLDVLNEETERISKDIMNEKIIALSESMKEKDDTAMAEAFQELIPVFEKLDVAVKEVIA